MLGITKEEQISVRIAALLHDVGHGPLSHTSEELLARYLGQPHEDISREIIENSSISKVLEEGGQSPKKISGLLKKKSGYLGKIISSEFDVDRMDYLVRDAHHTGVAYGIIDLDRLINTIQVHRDTLVITEGGRIADVMFLKATEVAIQEGLDFKKLYKMDDFDILNLFRASKGYVKDINDRIENRRLFKSACSFTWDEMGWDRVSKAAELRKDVKQLKRVEDEMAGDSGAGSGYVLLDIPPFPDYREMDAHVLQNGNAVKLESASPLVGILREAQKSQWNVSVYTPYENLENVRKICENFESYID
jgi:HD superfamily phosphohydrolase